MKRSDMLKVLRRDIVDYSCIDHCMNKDEINELLEMVLIGIEEAGMLPPAKKPMHHFVEDQVYFMKKAYFKWEPEEDEHE